MKQARKKRKHPPKKPSQPRSTSEKPEKRGLAFASSKDRARVAAKGGMARAAALSKRRRREIAAAGGRARQALLRERVVETVQQDLEDAASAKEMMASYRESGLKHFVRVRPTDTKTD